MSREPVKCHACGGVFDEDARVCTYCGAGVRFAGLGLPGRSTNLSCPRCGSDTKLYEVRYRGVDIDVCPRCEGSWYDLGELDVMVRNSRQEAKQGTFQPSAPAMPKQEDVEGRHDDVLNPVYIRCPHCDKVMGRKNWESRSGIMIDWCLEHGFWLDGGELQRVRAWSAQHPDGPPPPIEAYKPKETNRSEPGGSLGFLASSEPYAGIGGSHRAVADGTSWIMWFLGRLFHLR